jgi:inner membrane protein
VKFAWIVKIGALLAVVLALMFGLGLIKDVVHDRLRYKNAASSSVAQSIAGSQTVVGPVVHSACVETWDVKGPGKTTYEERREFMLMALPETLTVKSNVGLETRTRSLYPVNVFTLKAQLVAQYPSLNKLRPVSTVKNSRMNCGSPIVMLSVDDPRGIRSAQLSVGGQVYKLKAGTFHPAYSRGVHAALPDAMRQSADPLTLEIELELVGTERLSIVPLGETTQVRMQSNWPHPSFGGRFSPADRSITTEGFDANWRVTSMASSAGLGVLNARPTCDDQSEHTNQDADTDASARAAYAVSSANADAAQTEAATAARSPLADAPAPRQQPQPAAPAFKGCTETLQVAFIDPINPYSLSDRATKYGVLFIALTFLAVGLFELMNGLRVHPVQYFLVGSALSIFFLLLVSLSEHLSFNASYASAGAGCVLLLTYYASHMLGGIRRGLPFGLGIALLYGLLFVLLQLEQTALVVGAIAMFAVLAMVMALTRKVNWYGLSVSTSTNAANAASPTRAQE